MAVLAKKHLDAVVAIGTARYPYFYISSYATKPSFLSDGIYRINNVFFLAMNNSIQPLNHLPDGIYETDNEFFQIINTERNNLALKNNSQNLEEFRTNKYILYDEANFLFNGFLTTSSTWQASGILFAHDDYSQERKIISKLDFDKLITFEDAKDFSPYEIIAVVDSEIELYQLLYKAPGSNLIEKIKLIPKDHNTINNKIAQFERTENTITITSDKLEELYEGEYYLSPTMYLVTNKHVLEELPDDEILVRIPPNHAQNVNKSCIQIKIREAHQPLYTVHPNPKVDIAVLPVNGIQQIYEARNEDMNFFRMMDCLLKHEMNKEGLTEGDSCFLLGYPSRVLESKHYTHLMQYPIARNGIIAEIRSFYHNDSHSGCYLIDTNNFPGNSGGAVINKPNGIAISGTECYNQSRLIGIVKSYIPHPKQLIDQSGQRLPIAFQENSGLALVEPVDRILETIKQYEQDHNKLKK